MKRAKQVVQMAALFVSGSTAFAAAEQLPDLLPPHGELPPSYWEQHRWVAVVAVALVLVALLALVLWLRRKRPVVITSPDLLARQSLEALRGSVEDGTLLMQVSSILRRYVVFACNLPPGEMTTAEICGALAAHPRFSPDLAAVVGEFLHRCDERKFAPRPPPPTGSVVDTALELVRKIDRRRHEPGRTVPPPIPESALVSRANP